MNTPQITFTTGGTVQAGGGVYLARQADEDLLQLCRAGRFAYILTARQMGKSSLMVRTVERLTAENIRAVMIDLTQIGTQVTPEQWYLGLLAMIEEQLQLPTDAVAWWQAHAHLGLTQRLTRFLQEVLLREITDPIVIFVDEIDTTLSLDFTDDFFAAIRSYANARATAPEFARLSFVLIGVATPGDLIRDPQRTPFNIGQRVDLTDFTRTEAQPFADGLRLHSTEAYRVIERVLHWTNGHPYLTQRLCQALVDEHRTDWITADVDRVVERTFFGAMSEQDNNLQFIRDMLTKRANDVGGVLTTYREIRSGNRIVLDEEQSLNKLHLKLSGIVWRSGMKLHVRNRIYETVFDEQWVKNHLPVNWHKQFKLAVVTLLAAIIIFSPAIATNVWKNNQLALANNELEKALVEAELQRNLAQSRELAAHSDLVALADPDLRLSLVAEAVRRAQTSQAEDALRKFLAETSAHAALRGHSASVKSASYSPDGRLIVTASNDGTARIWNALTMQTVAELNGDEHTAGVNSAAFSPDGKRVVTANNSGTAIIWSSSTAAIVSKLQLNNNSGGSLYFAAFSPDGKFVITASEDGKARVWDVSNSRVIAELKGNYGDSSFAVKSISYNPNGKSIITATSNNIRVWDALTNKLINEFKVDYGSINSAAYSPDGKFIVTANADRTAYVLDTTNARPIARLSGHSASVKSAAYSPDGRHIVTTSDDGIARIWNTANNQLLTELKGHTAEVDRAAFSPDGAFIVTASDDRTARIWKISGPRPAIEVKSSTASVNSATYSPEGKFIITASGERAYVWEVASGRLITEIKGHIFSVNSAVFSPNGNFIATASGDLTASIWEAASGHLIAKLTGHSTGVKSAAFSPDGKFVVTASDKTTRIWSTSVGRLIAELKGHLDIVNTATYSPDGKFIVTASDDHTARVWSVSNSQVVAEFIGHSAPVRSATYSPDGKFIVTASDDRTARIWDSSNFQVVAELIWHSAPIRSAVYSPDGKFVLTASDDRTACVWDVSTTQIVAELKGHSDSVRSAVYSPDGKFIITASDDRTTRIWPQELFEPFEETLERLRRLSPRELTKEERARYLPAAPPANRQRQPAQERR